MRKTSRHFKRFLEISYHWIPCHPTSSFQILHRHLDHEDPKITCLTIRKLCLGTGALWRIDLSALWSLYLNMSFQSWCMHSFLCPCRSFTLLFVSYSFCEILQRRMLRVHWLLPGGSLITLTATRKTPRARKASMVGTRAKDCYSLIKASYILQKADRW